MRYLAGLVCALALGVMRCSETSGTGGSGGTSGTGGDGGTGGYVCTPGYGEPGAGGGGYEPPQLPGVYSQNALTGEQFRIAVRFETSSDCTTLVPSTECAIDSANTEPVVFEIEFEGLDEQGKECSAGIAVTPEMVTEVPIQDAGRYGARFTIELTGDDGAEWLVDGEFSAPFGVEGSARRTDGDRYCETPWFANEGCAF